jgi:hypothetical protein
MPANVGEMFYYGEVPWHGLGTRAAAPVTVEQALKLGGLDWEVGECPIQTCEEPSSPVSRRKALVRLDRPPGHAQRVVGVVHQGFRPLQNREGVMLVDAIFGHGQAVYHTGGYLGCGEVGWLLAQIAQRIVVGNAAADDTIEAYALFCNSHDGSNRSRSA